MMKNDELKLEVKNLLQELKNYVENAHASGVIVGNRGGKDSAVVIGLLALALGKEKVLTVTMPCESKEQDRKDALVVAETFGVRCINVSLDNAFIALKQSIEAAIEEKLDSEPIVNMKPRLRMTTLRTIAQQKNYLLMGTVNLCEFFVGYFTKDGDGACDYNPLGRFSVEEVYQIARFIGVPEIILKKAPSDGLGKLTDEEKLGVTYDQITEYIVTGKTDVEAARVIARKHKATEHKRHMPKIYERITKLTWR